MRPIVSRNFGRFSVDLNPIFELPTVSEEERTLELPKPASAGSRAGRLRRVFRNPAGPWPAAQCRIERRELQGMPRR